MPERAFTFGDGAAMVAIASEPASGVVASRPAVLILNAGVVHRIGPSRNSVKIARRLADDGFLVMRFDLTGIGDSASRRGGRSVEDNAAIDITQAMDHLEKTRGIKQFVLVGLCSGADNSLAVADEDKRVVGAILMDGYGYRTPRYWAHYYARRVRGLRTNKGMLTRLAGRLSTRAKTAVLSRLERAKPEREAEPTELAPTEVWERAFPTRDEFAGLVRRLVSRDLKLLFLYSGGIEPYYIYEGQLLDSISDVNLRGLVETEYFETSDHTFTELESSARLERTVADWFARRFPREARAPANVRDRAVPLTEGP